MKYIILVSHGLFAPGLHNALSMLTGARADIRSTSLEDGMSSDVYAGHFRECLKGITRDDEILLFGDLIGGSPLTTAANIIAGEGLLDRTTMIGGMNFPLILVAAMTKDGVETKELVETILREGKDGIRLFTVEAEETEEEV